MIIVESLHNCTSAGRARAATRLRWWAHACHWRKRWWCVWIALCAAAALEKFAGAPLLIQEIAGFMPAIVLACRRLRVLQLLVCLRLGEGYYSDLRAAVAV